MFLHILKPDVYIGFYINEWVRIQIGNKQHDDRHEDCSIVIMRMHFISL